MAREEHRPCARSRSDDDVSVARRSGRPLTDRWRAEADMVAALILTLPVAAAGGAVFYTVIRLLFGVVTT